MPQTGRATLPTTLTANSDGGMGDDGWMIHFILWCDGDWTIESDSDWVSPYGDDNSGGTTSSSGRKIWLTIKNSPGTEKRNAVLTVKKTETGETLKVYVTQPPVAPTFRVDTICFAPYAPNYTAVKKPSFTLWSDGDWTAKSDSSWVTVRP